MFVAFCAEHIRQDSERTMRFGRLTGTLLAFIGFSCLPCSEVESRHAVTSTTDRPRDLLPIIFVPGKGGSQIEARVNRTGLLRDHGLPDCQKNLDWYLMWMDLWIFFKRQFFFALVRAQWRFYRGMGTCDHLGWPQNGPQTQTGYGYFPAIVARPVRVVTLQHQCIISQFQVTTKYFAQ